MTNAWRNTLRAVLGILLITGTTTLPPWGGAAYAQAVGETRTVQQDAGIRTDTSAETSATYDPRTGITTIRRKQNTVRLYNERTETYRQTGNREETRYRQEPVYETRYRKEQWQRQEQQPIARTGYREETRNETRYRPVYETKTRQVEKTGTRTETRYRTEYEPIYRTEAYQDQEAYTAYGWRWETRYTYSWQWVTHARTENVLRWYTSPGHYEHFYEAGFDYPSGHWGQVLRSRWVSGYRYSSWETVSVPYQTCDLVATPYQECVSYAYTAYRPVTRYRSVFSSWRPYTVAYSEQVPYTYDETETYQEQVYDVTGYRDVYGYTWVEEPYRSYELLYPGATYGYVTRARQVWKYALLGREAIMTPRQEAYQVPVTVKVAYTYYEPVTVTATYYRDVPYDVPVGTRTVGYQVVTPIYEWVPDGDWQAKEAITGTSYLTVARVGAASKTAEASNPAQAKSSTFLSDNSTGDSTTQISGSRKRLLFKADQAIASSAKRVEGGEGQGNSPPPVAASGSAAASNPGFTVSDWVGTWTQGNYTVVITRVGDGLTYAFRVRNGGSWKNAVGGTLGNGNAAFTDNAGGDVGTSASLSLSRVEGSSALRITGSIQSWGTRYTFDNLRK
ncbi:MAG TPA: hypothetical protein V6D05_00675 [Stenomitos sp.]